MSRPEVKACVKFIHRARKALNQCDSTTVNETIKLVKAVAALRGMIMLHGQRGRNAMVRAEAEARAQGDN